MKKFFTLFALLSVVLSASAYSFVPDGVTENDSWVVCICEPSLNYWKVYIWDDTQIYTEKWPGDGMTYAYDVEGKKIFYKVFKDKTIPSTANVQFNNGVENGNKTPDMTFVNKGIYVDNHFDHADGDTGFDVYFDNSNTNWGSVRVYAWTEMNLNNGWPGITMEQQSGNIYKAHIEANNFTKLLFNKGDDENNKTEDFTLTDGMTYTNNVTLVEGQNLQYQNTVTASKAHYERTIAVDEWGTLCLPFPITGSNEYVTFYELNGVSSTALTFAPITTSPIPAGTPMLFKRISGEGSNLWIEEKNVEINPNPGQGGIDGFTMHGTFNLLSNQSDVYILYGGDICLGTSGITINPYRAWFTSNSNSQAPFRIEVADTEGLQYVEQEDGTVKAYYDLQGRKLNGARKGLIIENGKIIMVK